MSMQNWGDAIDDVQWNWIKSTTLSFALDRWALGIGLNFLCHMQANTNETGTKKKRTPTPTKYNVKNDSLNIAKHEIQQSI